MRTLQTVLRLHLSRLELNRATRGHVAAFEHPRGIEKPLVHLIQFIVEYADTYKREMGVTIGQTIGVRPSYWLDIFNATGHLFTGDCGRLNCDEMFTLLRELGNAAGVPTT